MWLKNKKGFTLIELLIVIAVLGIIAAVVAPRFMGTLKLVGNKADIQSAHLFATELEQEFMLGKITLDASGGAIIKHDATQGYSGVVPSANDKVHDYLAAGISKLSNDSYKLIVYYDEDSSHPLTEVTMNAPFK